MMYQTVEVLILIPYERNDNENSVSQTVFADSISLT